MEISVVIPIYNVTKHAVKHLPLIIESLAHKYKDFELLFMVDNLHINNEIENLIHLSKNYKQIKVHFLNKNYGQHFATLCGYYLAKGDFIVCIDEDMSKYIVEVCNTNEYKDVDVFYFYYNKNDMYKSSVRKFFSNSYKSVINKIVNLKKHSTFRIISKDLRNRMLEDKHVFWNLDVMIFDNTQKVGSHTLYIPDLSDNDTTYNYKKLCQIAFEIVYEHNNIVTNLLLLMIPALLCYGIYANVVITVLLYLLSVILASLYFLIKKRRTLSTEQKILDALAN